MKNNPIGILDSGLGGLSIWKEIVKLLSDESTIYLADSLNCPYGDRSSEDIYNLARRLVQFLIHKHVKLIVIACNTITTTSLEKLREEFPQVPIIGTVPVVKTAADLSHKKRIGILSTQATALSVYQQQLIHKYAAGYTVINRGTDRLVPFIERGELVGIELARVLKEELEEYRSNDVDVLALGCSHFPFLRDSIQRIMGESVTILDSGLAVARQVKRVLEKEKLLSNTFSFHHFYTTGDLSVFPPLVKKLLEGKVSAKRLDLIEYRIMKDYAEKNVAVLGFGIEGQSVVEFLLKQNSTITVFDEQDESTVESEKLDEYRKKGVKFQFGKTPSLLTFDVIVRSPGIPLTKPELQEAREHEIEVTSGTKIFFDLCPARIIGVTGTKGKGTTSSLIHEMLQKGGFKAFLGGNIGVPPLSFLDEVKSDSWVVLELSSFQLQDLTKSPHIAVMLMVTSEHLDYHKDTEEYVDAKRNIVRFQGYEDYAILNRDYPSSNESDVHTLANIFQVSRMQGVLDNGCYINEGKVMLKINNKEEKIINTKEILLPGGHNLENVCAAVTAAHLAGVKKPAIIEVLKTFKGLEHRLELVSIISGVKYYDDSFSTTPETAMAAIEAFEEPEILILGGSSKNSDFTFLGDLISERDNIKAIIGIGKEWQRIKKTLHLKPESTMLILEGATSMHDIVLAVSKIATLGDVVLLTPACASFDMFKNYKDRGKQFKEEVLKLKENVSQ